MSHVTRVYTSARGKVAHLTSQGTVSLCGLWYPEGFLGTGYQEEYERAADLPVCHRCKARNGGQDVDSHIHHERLPLGTPVLFWPGAKAGPGRPSVTSSPVWPMGGTLCVTVKDYAGGIALSHIERVSP
jgi:hypothetical protein